jgi:ABC-2 type transport system ATP-binding protein
MRSLLEFDGLRLDRQAKEWNATLRPGACVGIFGPSGAGKTALLRAAVGLDRVRYGHVRRAGDAALAGEPPPSRKLTVETWARKFAGPRGQAQLAEALAATGLWHDRKKAIVALGPSRQASVELLAVLAGRSEILAVDGQFDRLDPWTSEACAQLLAKRLDAGACALVATNRLDWARRFDLISVWRNRSPVFTGAFDDLSQEAGPKVIEVETLRPREAKALCDPFEVRIEETSSGLRIETREDQALAARLLQEGFGNVRAVVSRPRSPADLLRPLGE